MKCSRLVGLFHRFSTKKSHYDILGVSKTASADEIKKAFYKIAQQLHPDKNPDPRAKQKFAEANNAYEILSDLEKRRQYDGESGFTSSRSTRASGFTGGAGGDPFEEFSKDFFKDRGSSYYEGFSTGSARKTKGEDITRAVDINFVDAAKGKKINLKYEKVDVCHTCNGNRCKPGTVPTRCLACGGSGTTTLRQGSMSMHIPCHKCQGIGLIIKNPCNECKAKGVINSTVTEEITIPAGSNNGDSVRFQGKGNRSQNGPNGDLFVQLNVKPHQRFRRKGLDIESTEFLTISQAVLGHKKSVQTMYGPKEVTFSPGFQDGQKITLKGLGIHKLAPMLMQKGDHVIVTRVKIPKSLTPTQRQLFMEIAKTEQKVSKAEQQQQEAESEGVFDRFKNIFR